MEITRDFTNPAGGQDAIESMRPEAEAAVGPGAILVGAKTVSIPELDEKGNQTGAIRYSVTATWRKAD